MFNSPRDSMLLTLATLSLGLACSSGDDSGSDDDGSSALGGYTGLGTYVGVSGVYGSGGNGTGGTTGASGGSPTSEGGSLASTNTSSQVGGKGSVGGSTTGASANGGGPANGGTSANGGSSPTSAWLWPDTYDPNGTALVATGEHRAGLNCMSSTCHGPTTGTRAFAFGGTVYQSNGTTAAAHVEVAVVSGTKTYTTYSGANGNFWIPLASASNIDWTTAKVHLRTATGELTKPAGAEVGSGCNSCHVSGSRITTP
ncbi:MAG: hypothetical protein QM784_11265 [Polyangiaceae bacterium]